MNALLASGGWVLDILFFALLILGILFGVRRGFIAGVCKLAGTFLAVFIAVTFCVALQASLERSFGWTSAINSSIGSPFGEWIMVAVSFIFLLILTKAGCFLIGKFGSALVDGVKPLKIVNMLLGGLLGALKMFILLFILFAVFRWIPSDSLHEFISSSGVVGKMFNSEWFIAATSLNFHR